MKSKAAFLLVSVQLLSAVARSYTIHGDSVDSSIGLEKSEVISLYDHTDDVVELTDANFTASVYESNQLWFIEFYAHWCGHCQKFKPVWINAARTFKSQSSNLKTFPSSESCFQCCISRMEQFGQVWGHQLCPTVHLHSLRGPGNANHTDHLPQNFRYC